ncbi:hypothetical protein PVL29_014892 [Vitis rotundifolia]|uniref:Serine carboxypeptidase-like 18 n=2 Tax=Vitis rotundifolia TaxID=103349 RepID=A0AA39DPF4_VITRO|nr:hypothetical protein PVL29_014892 [Vitis rotundifolia]
MAEHRHFPRRLLLLLPFLFSAAIANTSSIIKTLPGYSGELPFYLESGYVGVGDNEEVQLFYLFVKSQRNPVLDPLVMWLTGGPGCSTFSAFFYGNGPLGFDYENYAGGLPSLQLNEYTWTSGLNIIYVDIPVGAGFSYSRTQEGYYSDDYKSSTHTYEFLNKWLLDHPEFLKNNLYVGGDSYSGIVLPMIAQKIYYGNGIGEYLQMNFQGYILGNPVTDSYIDGNAQIIVAHRLTLISDDLYESAKASCNGDYVTVNASNEGCVADMEAISKLITPIYTMHVLEPNCGITSQKPNERKLQQRSLIENTKHFPSGLGKKAAYHCHDYMYVLSEIWSNNESVREALHVREGTKGHWVRCNISGLAYTKVVKSSVPYQRNLTQTGLRALIYSGDHDMSIPHVGTQEWINSLNLTVDDTWRAWYTDAQVSGYTQRFTNDDFSLTFATVKGAGHVAIEFRPRECYAMIKRWFASFPL